MNPFALKLSKLATLTASDRAALTGFLAQGTTLRLPAKHTIGADDVTRGLLVLVDGSAYSVRYAADGRRQILCFFVPGDIVDAAGSPESPSQSVVAGIASTFLRLDRAPESVPDLMARAGIARAVQRCKLQTENVLREWIFTLGRRDGRERIAALLCELHWRYAAVGLITPKGFNLPLTQEEMADATGLSPVHVNRCISRLQRPGLIALRRNHVEIPDLPALAKIAQWEPAYLLYGPDLDPQRPPAEPPEAPRKRQNHGAELA